MLLGGCAALSPAPPPIIAAGDRALLDNTCRLEDGAILATTRKDAALAEDARFSHAFVPLQAYAPVPVTVGAERRLPATPDIVPLMDEIADRVSQELAGLTYGETHKMSVSAETIEGLSDMARYIQFARSMRRPKQREVPREQFTANTGQEPVAGQVLFADSPMPWEVLAVDEETVEVSYKLEDGQKIMMPYGEAVVRDRGDHYDLEIDTRIDGLVRVGPYIGRICEVGERVFTVDFDHPFGGRELACEVTARPLETAAE
jgi:FKBP-type peptidyl-prolyl cis-trans isomerase 2